MVKLSALIANSTPSFREEVRDWIKALKNNGQGVLFCKNLMSEAQLARRHWNLILNSVAKRSGQTEELQLSITRLIRDRAVDLQLQGRIEERALGLPLYRASLLSSLAYLVSQEDESGMTHEQACFALYEIIMSSTVSLPQWLQKMELGKHVMWATYEQIDNEDVEDGVMDALVWCRLGLLDPARSEPDGIVLLAYQLPSDILPHVPTILDAYGAWPWPYYYMVAEEEDGVLTSRTLPRSDCTKYRGFAEVVHKPGTFAEICKPMRFLDIWGMT